MTRTTLSSCALLCALVAAAGFSSTRADAADTKMKDLMKRVGAGMAAGEAKPLAPLLTQSKALTPADPKLAPMNAMFDKAIAAANQGDLDAVKASCKPCHDAYRDDYRKRFGSKAP